MAAAAMEAGTRWLVMQPDRRVFKRRADRTNINMRLQACTSKPASVDTRQQQLMLSPLLCSVGISAQYCFNKEKEKGFGA